MDHDDPLDRLAAEERDWAERARRIERQTAREARAARRRRPRIGSGNRVPRPPRVHSGGGISWIFLALVALTLAGGAALWTGVGSPGPIAFGFVLAGWLVSLCLHEFSHALTAHRGGDDTVAGKGYLRLDPRRYGHPVLTLLLPLLFLIAGGIPLPGGAVMIENHRLRNRFRDSLVSAAGPAVNIGIAAVLLVVVAVAGPAELHQMTRPPDAFWAALTFLAYLQVATAILNLLPVPGLDGYGIIEPYLPDRTRQLGARIKPFGLILLFLAIFAIPPARAAFTAVTGGIVDSAGAPVNGAYQGFQLFQFWGGW